MDAFLELFSPSGRANRARYFWHVVLDDLVVFAMSAMLFMLGGFALPGLVSLPLAGIAFAAGWAALAVTAKRLHDLNRSAWHLLLLAIPFYNIYLALVLLLKAGTDGPNRFGPDPLEDLKLDGRLPR